MFRPIAVRVDAVLIAANLADVDLAFVSDTHGCEYDALDRRPEPAAVSLEPAETASAASEVHDSYELWLIRPAWLAWATSGSLSQD